MPCARPLYLNFGHSPAVTRLPAVPHPASAVSGARLEAGHWASAVRESMPSAAAASPLPRADARVEGEELPRARTRSEQFRAGRPRESASTG
jgi:hypothetical protein